MSSKAPEGPHQLHQDPLCELDRNPQTAERVVRELNGNPTLPFADACFDGAMCAV